MGITSEDAWAGVSVAAYEESFDRYIDYVHAVAREFEVARRARAEHEDALLLRLRDHGVRLDAAAAVRRP
jgi:hypothetical protein